MGKERGRERDPEFTARLKTLFNGSGLTQAELARGIQRSQGTVSDYLTKGMIPDGYAMLLLPGVLSTLERKVNGHWLLTGEGTAYGSGAGTGPSFFLGAHSYAAAVKVAIQAVDREWQAAQGASARGPSVDPASVGARLSETDAHLASAQKAKKPHSHRRSG